MQAILARPSAGAGPAQVSAGVRCRSAAASPSPAARSRAVRRSRRSDRMNTTIPRMPIPANMNHCIAYQKCGPLVSSGTSDRHEAARLRRGHLDRADEAVGHRVADGRLQGVGVDQPHRPVHRVDRAGPALFVASDVTDDRHLAARGRWPDGRDAGARHDAEESAVDQHRPGGRPQRRDDLVAPVLTVVAVADDELVLAVEGPGGGDPLPLVGVDDRPGSKTCSYACTGACSLLIVVALRVSRSDSRRSCHSPRLTNSTARATTKTTSSAHRTHSRRTSPG